MRAIVGVLTSATLTLSLFSATALAQAPVSITSPQPDLASALMLRLFGETADTTASFSAQNGDRTSESPLRELALRVPAGSAPSGLTGAPAPGFAPEHLALSDLSGVETSYLARAIDAGLISDAHFAAPPQASQPQASPLITQTGLLQASYQPVAPVPSISPGPGTMAFDSTTAAPSSAVTQSEPLSLGSDRSARRGLSLNVSGGDERTNPSDFSTAAVPAPNAASWQLPDASAQLAVPNYAGSQKLSLNAGVAVPVFHGVTLNLNYDAQRSYAANLYPGLQNLDAANNLYVGGLTYKIPYSSSSLSISAYQNRFGESVLPLNGYTQTGEDVNFTVKF
ncbi:MAG TPA: hypothetical protein VGX91_02400 [Candidatus Cybelea sp.]|nr:hypothetical protein [Candidatus Cybelea sp.]